MDFQTLMVFHATINLTCCIGLLVLALQFRAQPGTRQWALCGLYQVASLAAYTLYGSLDSLLLAFAGSVLTLLSLLSYVDATRIAAGISPLSRLWKIIGLGPVIGLQGALALWGNSVTPRPQPMAWDNYYDWYSGNIDSLAAVLATLVIVHALLKSRVWREQHWWLYSLTVTLMGVLAVGHLLVSLQSDEHNYALLLQVEQLYPLLSAVLLVGITMGAVLIVAGGLQQETHIRATRDPLTGLYNRLGFEEAFEKQAAWAMRNQGSISLVLCDIDHFKKINDTYGHQRGDEIIRTLAQTLENNARTTDIVARFGGEEYLITLYDDSSAQSGQRYSERVRQLIAETPRAVEPGYTASFGIAVQTGQIDFDSLFKAADAALYQAKRGGRDRISLAASPTPAS